MEDLILASGSPRRAELLGQLGLRFRVIRPHIDETMQPAEQARDYVTRMSSEKLLAARQSGGRAADILLCADTVVVVDNDVLGKPRDQADALAMLQRLSSRQHKVLTSVNIADERQNHAFVVETLVAFRPLTIEECTNYWATGEPRDKAGAYGIQGVGAVFVQSIEGSYSNVVGLPLMETAQTLRKFGIDCLDGGRRHAQQNFERTGK